MLFYHWGWRCWAGSSVWHRCYGCLRRCCTVHWYSDNGVLIEYILYFLRSAAGYEQLTKHKKATTQESISIEAIRNVLMPIPPLNEQERIVSAIDTALNIVQKL